MDAVLDFLDNLPVPTLIVVAGIVGAIIALASHSIDFQEFMVSLGVLAGGSGVLAHGRAAAKGSKRKRR